MAKGQLPKAYLRIDPNIDTHPDCGAMLVLILWANRQPERGRFRSLDTIRKVLGKRRLQACLDRGDLKPQDDGTHFLEGWNEWQEGDFTVGERMRLVRSRKANKLQANKRNDVTSALLQNRNGPSETVRQQGSKAVRQERKHPPAVPAAPSAMESEPTHQGNGAVKKPGHATWLTPFGDAWKERFGAESEPRWGEMAEYFARPYRELDRDDFEARWRRFLAAAEKSTWASPARFVQGLGEWAENARPPARAGPLKANGTETMAALERFRARRQVDEGSSKGDSVRGDADPPGGRLPPGTK